MYVLCYYYINNYVIIKVVTGANCHTFTHFLGEGFKATFCIYANFKVLTKNFF